MATEMSTTEVEVPNPVCPKGGKRDITVKTPSVDCGEQYHLYKRVYQLIA